MLVRLMPTIFQAPNKLLKLSQNGTPVFPFIPWNVRRERVCVHVGQREGQRERGEGEVRARARARVCVCVCVCVYVLA